MFSKQFGDNPIDIQLIAISYLRKYHGLLPAASIYIFFSVLLCVIYGHAISELSLCSIQFDCKWTKWHSVPDTFEPDYWINIRKHNDFSLLWGNLSNEPISHFGCNTKGLQSRRWISEQGRTLRIMPSKSCSWWNSLWLQTSIGPGL